MMAMGVAKPERARAGDDQHRHGVHNGVRKARLGADDRPRDERDDRDGNHCGDKLSRNFVGEFLDGRAAALGCADHADDLRQQGFVADVFGAHDE